MGVTTPHCSGSAARMMPEPQLPPLAARTPCVCLGPHCLWRSFPLHPISPRHCVIIMIPTADNLWGGLEVPSQTCLVAQGNVGQAHSPMFADASLFLLCWLLWQAPGPQHFLTGTECTRRDYISRLATGHCQWHHRCLHRQALSESVLHPRGGAGHPAAVGPDCIVDTTGRTNKRCHKHCLHSFNYTVKVRLDEFQATTKYQGPPPDVSFVLF